MLLSSAVPTNFCWTQKTVTRPSPSKRRRCSDKDEGAHQSPKESNSEQQIFTDPPLQEHDYCLRFVCEENINDQLVAAREEIDRLKHELQEIIFLYKFGLARYMYNDDMINFYTGFKSWTILGNFISLVKPTAAKMKTWAQVQRARGRQKPKTEEVTILKKQSLCLEDQLFLVLCKIKLGLFEQDLAERFKISVATVSRTFLTWINFLYVLLGSLPIWPSREQVNKTMPKCFQDVYPTVRVIIDCTEMKVQTPSSLVLHSECYSSYKSATTLKGLIGITPLGAVSFISALYTGSISDKEITRRSGLVELLEPKDGVMADKGFTIEDLLTPKQCTLNIPPFLRQKPQFIKEDVEKTQEIARLRIHVERAIRRVKEFHILDSYVPLSLCSSVNQLWTVCCILTNFQGPLF